MHCLVRAHPGFAGVTLSSLAIPGAEYAGRSISSPGLRHPGRKRMQHPERRRFRRRGPGSEGRDDHGRRPERAPGAEGSASAALPSGVNARDWDAGSSPWPDFGSEVAPPGGIIRGALSLTTGFITSEHALHALGPRKLRVNTALGGPHRVTRRRRVDSLHAFANVSRGTPVAPSRPRGGSPDATPAPGGGAPGTPGPSPSEWCQDDHHVNEGGLFRGLAAFPRSKPSPAAGMGISPGSPWRASALPP